MTTMTRAASVGVAGALAAAFFACNAILDNTPGVLVREDAGATEPMPTSSTPPADTRPPPAATGRDAATDASDKDASAPPQVCPPTQRLCKGACVDAADPRYGCGAPGCQPCALLHATATCSAGRCAIATCFEGFGDCDARPETGCETDLSSAATCGSCTNACPPAAPLCEPSAGTYECSNGCPPVAPLLCGEGCVDPLTSATSCGGCNRPCLQVPNGTAACVAGICTATCRPGFRACAGTCVPADDVNACGPTCAACPVFPNARSACVADACTAVCDPGFADCDRIPANGCEALLAADPLNCGACATPCIPGARCVDGACVLGPPDRDR